MISGVIDNRYRPVRKVGEGGMGEVWLTMDVNTRALYAIKVLHRTLVRPKDLQRFQREVDALRRLDHPNIVKFHHALESLPGYVMEYCPEGNIEEFFIAHPEADPYECMIQVGNAVEHLHKNHFVHRDIKPQNVLVGPDGCFRLTDFGLVVEADADRTMITTSNWVSYGFSPPEQHRNMAEVTEKGDVFSLGAVLFFLRKGAAFDWQLALDGQLEGLNDMEKCFLRQTLQVNPGSRNGSIRELGRVLTHCSSTTMREYFSMPPAGRLSILQAALSRCALDDKYGHWSFSGIQSFDSFASAVSLYEKDLELSQWIAARLKTVREHRDTLVNEVIQQNP